MRPRLLLAALLALAAGCFASIDESKIGRQTPQASDDDDDDDPKRDGGRSTTKRDGGPGTVTDSGPSDPPITEDGAPAPPRSCRDVEGNGPQTITIGDKPLTVFCENKATLVFKVSSGTKGDPYVLYTTPPLNDEVAAQITPNRTNDNYASRLLARWGVELLVDEAIVRLYDDSGKVLKELLFDAKGSTATTFFTKERLKSSPWTDLNKTSFFSPIGGNEQRRRFFIHGPYSVCENDEGWMVIHGSDSWICPYERPEGSIRLYYASGSTAQKWVNAIPEARSFAIFVR